MCEPHSEGGQIADRFETNSPETHENVLLPWGSKLHFWE